MRLASLMGVGSFLVVEGELYKSWVGIVAVEAG
jgi:hypothetical protein